MDVTVVGVKDLERASYDRKFRDLFAGKKTASGETVESLIAAFHSNPGCGCNAKLWAAIAAEKDALVKHFGPIELDDYLFALAVGKKEWNVIDTNVESLEDRMNELSPGPKQISIALFEDRVVVLWRDLS